MPKKVVSMVKKKSLCTYTYYSETVRWRRDFGAQEETTMTTKDEINWKFPVCLLARNVIKYVTVFRVYRLECEELDNFYRRRTTTESILYNIIPLRLCA